MSRMSGKQLVIQVTVVIERDGSQYHAYCPNLKGLHVGGATIDETLENATDAVIVYLNSLVRHGDPLPVGPFCNVVERKPRIPKIPQGAFLRHIQLQWPSLRTFGTA